MRQLLKRILPFTLLMCILLTVVPMHGFAAEKTSPVRVDAQLVADDCVSSSYYTHAAAGVVNGHDYLYLATRGGKFIVYDVDDRRQIDSETLDTDTPRSVTVDENGIVWVAAGRGFLRYDPFSQRGQIVSISWFDGTTKSTLGQTSDGNGKIYFGTLNNGYIGCYDTATKKSQRISSWLGISPTNVKDSKQSGYGGLAYKDGYLYLGIDGDMNNDGNFVHAIIKYDIANQKIVQSLDITEHFNGRQYLDYVSIVDNMLFCSFLGKPNKPIYIDISGDTMKFVELPGLAGHTAAVTEEVNGKRYFVGYYGEEETKGIVEYDVATKTSKMMKEGNYAFRLRGQNFVTVEGDDRLPGQSVMIPYNDEVAGVINIAFWNPQTNEYVTYEANIGLNGAEGSILRSMAVDPAGKYVYVGAYGNIGISKYSVEEGRIVDSFKSYGHQTDCLRFYDGYLYAGNYSAGTITQIDPETNEVRPLFSLRYSAFEQCRMHALAVGDNKVFAGPTPYSGFGGVLVWYDLDKNLTYVAGGPSPEDVYYADTTGLTNETNLRNLQYTWYNAVTGEVADFDDDDDGKDNVYLPDGTRRFRGPIPDQMLNNLVYQDGYIYGTTSVHGSSGLSSSTRQAVLFVYDVAAMKVVATCDLATKLSGFKGQVPIIDQLAEDPEERGKFWGVISDTLFSFTFDKKALTFTVKKELSFGKNAYSLPDVAWGHRDLVFDGEYMYVAFGYKGTYMVRKSDPKEYYIINSTAPNSMVLAADNNLYWIDNKEGIRAFFIAEHTASLKENAAVVSVIRRINALSSTITAQDKDAILEARAAYEALPETQKAKVTNIAKLIAAEEALADLPDDTANLPLNTDILAVILGAVAIAGICVVTVLILKKENKK